MASPWSIENGGIWSDKYKKWVGPGDSEVDTECGTQAAANMATCNGCDKFVSSTQRCGECNCLMNTGNIGWTLFIKATSPLFYETADASLACTKCPLDKW